MSEAKRVTLTAISNTVSSTLMTAGSSSTLRFGADFLAPPDKPTAATAATAIGGGKGPNKTMRLKVELFQTDSNKYPEFDYAKLLHLERKKIKKLSKKSNGFSADPFEDNDDDVARIAKELERKYGSAYSSGRGKNKRDDVDIGLGYDESDSFIDNTEAYDEIIPDEVETIEGGFYINCGALEFKKLHTESMTTKTDEIIKMPNRPKKRVISSSSEESSSSDDEDDDDEDDDSDEDGDREDGGTGEETSVETQKSKSSTAAITKKPKVSNVNTATANTVKKKAENGNPLAKKKVKNVCGLSAGSSSNSPKPATDDMATDSERERSVKKITSVKDMLKAQRDNYLKSRTNDVKSSNGDNKDKSSEDEEDDDDETSSSDESDEDDESAGGNSDSNQSESKEIKDKKTVSSNEENQANEKLRSSDTKLPELDTDVLASVIEFRESAKSKNLLGKKFQFDDHLSESFLKIDDSLLCIDKPERNMVFAHFEYHLALPKYFFLRKAKQLRIKEEKLKSKRAFSKLHKAVSETMPAVIASYDAEMRRYGELQAFNGSDQPPKMPKKKFPWNTNIRNLLYEVYQVRWTSYPVLGTRKETLEEFITSYMSKKVVEIWPKSWMRHEELQKEIEKRKTAAKKAKEKGKTQTAASVATVPSIPGSNTLQNAQQLIANYNKQVEELSTRSNENSETDSVASSSTLSLKRKNMEGACTTKQSKSKAAKINGEQKKSKNVNHTDSAISPSKKSDHSINHIISPTSAATAGSSCSLAQTTSTSIFSSTVAALSQPLKHSSNTHVIDLDFYNASEILQTTKQIQQQAAAGNAPFPQFAIANVATLNSTKPSSRRESSGDSEIEIVGVFPAKVPAKKQKTNSRSATPNAYQGVSEKTHNNNNNRNSKKQTNATPGASNLIGMDVNKAVNSSFIDLRDDIEVKPILSTNANSSTQPTSSSSSVQSNTPQQ